LPSGTFSFIFVFARSLPGRLGRQIIMPPDGAPSSPPSAREVPINRHLGEIRSFKKTLAGRPAISFYGEGRPFAPVLRPKASGEMSMTFFFVATSSVQKRFVFRVWLAPTGRDAGSFEPARLPNFFFLTFMFEAQGGYRSCSWPRTGDFRRRYAPSIISFVPPVFRFSRGGSILWRRILYSVRGGTNGFN